MMSNNCSRLTAASVLETGDPNNSVKATEAFYSVGYLDSGERAHNSDKQRVRGRWTG
jgi:hypothetical protein